MPEKLGLRVPADPQRAARNRAVVRRLAVENDPVLVAALAEELAERKRPARAAARLRSR
jgi:hypothetical protein